MNKNVNRIVSTGYLLYERQEDGGYALVGVVDSALNDYSINVETGLTAAEEELEDFYNKGSVKFPVRMDIK